MKFLSKVIDIESDNYQDEKSLYFKFKGKFTEEASTQATQAWHEELNRNPLTKYVFVWDCYEMSGFEITARKIWYKYMGVHKRQLEEVVVISRSIIIRNAARVMLEFSGVRTTVIKSHEQFEKLKELSQV